MLTFELFTSREEQICVAGLGYVGLPLAVRLASKFKIVGFDVNQARIAELTKGHDGTGEVDKDDLQNAGLELSADGSLISESRLIIVTVPTPIDRNSRPDLRPILAATRTVGQHLKKGSMVVYESTVYPGLTEEECVPILEAESGLKWKEDFWVGYSPERINPGDKVHTVDKITKVVAGDTEETSRFLEEIYGSVITAGIHVAPSIAVAEAAKVIENTQRDLNIALMNELALIFGRLGISTKDVLEAAGTKWNFLKFTPGLVGGHCIGVDPYYLTHRAESVGYHPQVILAGRRINDDMGRYVAEQTVKHLIQANKPVNGSRVLILGVTFKENVPDLRNTRVIDIIRELEDYKIHVTAHDPYAEPQEALDEYNLELSQDFAEDTPYDAVILAVAHDAYKKDCTLEKLKSICSDPPILIDIKWLFDRKRTDEAGIIHWQL